MIRQWANISLVAVAALWLGLAPMAARATEVITYHNDNLRTGWNQAETALTPASVAGSSFGLVASVALDEQVDAQPLYLSGMQIKGAIHNVVYVVTENDTVYAIDADSGAVLLSRNLGTPVPSNKLPAGCKLNSDNLGIESTPVIDPATKSLYLIAYTYEDGARFYRIHALDLQSLADQVQPVVVSASATLVDGTITRFNGAYQRQRPALIETDGAIYAAFGSHCDVGKLSRGWVLGWSAKTLAPLAGNQLLDRDSPATDATFLNSVWMSGYGIASDDHGSLFFATANTDPGGYNAPNDLAESVVRLSTDLTTVIDSFTPGNELVLDQEDGDLGSGGVMLLPNPGGSGPSLAVAAGKTGPLYLFNRNDLGGFGAQPPTVQTYANQGCWCGESFYVGADKVGRVISSTGQLVQSWTVQTTTPAALTLETTGHKLPTGEAPGFFTSISSNGTAAHTALVWALLRPERSDTTHTITLVALDPDHKLNPVFSGAAGTWPFASRGVDPNLVPVAADGHVFVATYQQLAIFGLAPPAAHVALMRPQQPSEAVFTGTPHDLYGTVIATSPLAITLRTRTGALIAVDPAPAAKIFARVNVGAGHAALVRGDYDRAGNFVARFVLEAKDDSAFWGPDR